METIDNNQFEVKSSKRKVQPGPNVYLNPALSLLANEDPMCNNAMEITPNKRRKRTKSCSDIGGFENSGLDIGVSKTAVNEFLAKELANVRKNFKPYETPIKSNKIPKEEPIYANLTDLQEVNTNEPLIIDSEEATENNECQTDRKEFITAKVTEVDSGISVFESNIASTYNELENNSLSTINNTTNVHTNVTNQIFLNNSNNLNLSFIDRLAIDSPIGSNQSLYLDDDLNESNIMEIKTITIITKKKLVPCKKQTNPFLETNINMNEVNVSGNPFLDHTTAKSELQYNIENTMADRAAAVTNNLMPRRLFTNETNSTISTVNDSSINIENHEYENVDSYRAESPIYENINEDVIDSNYNKQSKILGYDVSQFSNADINNFKRNNQTTNSNDSNDSKKDLKHQLLKASNKLSRKVFKTLKKKFKGEKVEANTTLNPYEVPRKPPKQKVEKKDSGIENPGLFLDNSDEIEIEEIDEEHEYETVKTIRNTQLNTNVTPLKERDVDNIDNSQNKTFTPGKKVRFDSTLNKEKVITGNSFDYSVQSPGFDAKIDKYQDELENCINERKFIQQNM